MTMIEQWILEDERELEARCARFRSAQLAPARGGGEEDSDERAGRRRPGEADPAA
ncbi:hypothetical protein [Nonomuraea candida]|uniref:hypothetical protein n=1 Tax=Nonomuraea candida TaxID=359159 RepID=UPI0012FC53A4|nr:hypothetical protein [Nonomuraea candida]